MAEIKKQEVIKILKKIGYSSYKCTGNYVTVYVHGDRTHHFALICKRIKGAKWKQTPTKKSGMGEILLGKIRILVKPAGQQGINAPGVANERLFLQKVKNAIKKYDVIDINIIGNDGGTIRLSNVYDIQMSYSNFGQRSDFLLVGDKRTNIAIKQDDAHYWSRIEGYFGERANKIIKRLEKRGKVKLLDIDNDVQLSREIVVKPTPQDKRYAVFGTDKSKIVKKTFSKQDFRIVKKPDGSHELNITATFVASKITDLKGRYDVWFLIRNARGRVSRHLPNGITTMAITPARLNKTALVVKS